MKAERMSPEEEYEENVKLFKKEVRKSVVVAHLVASISIEELAEIYNGYVKVCTDCPLYDNCPNSNNCEEYIKNYIEKGEL